MCVKLMFWYNTDFKNVKTMLQYTQDLLLINQWLFLISGVKSPTISYLLNAGATCGLEVAWDMRFNYTIYRYLTHRGRGTHICVSGLTSIVSDNGLSPGRRQAITRTNAGILLIVPWGTNYSEILLDIQTFPSGKCIWECRLWDGVHFVSASMC